MRSARGKFKVYEDFLPIPLLLQPLLQPRDKFVQNYSSRDCKNSNFLISFQLIMFSKLPAALEIIFNDYHVSSV